MRRPLLLLLLATFALKVAVLARFNAHPLLQPAGNMDSGVYARLAADVARGDFLLRGPGPLPFFVSPFYIYFLAAIHALSAGSLLAAKSVQIALGTAAVALVFLTAKRLFGDRAALLAGILYALTGVVTFHEVLILQAALDPFLTALALYLLAVALTSSCLSSKVKEDWVRGSRQPESATVGAGGDGRGRWLASGAAFGLLSLNRPNALLCVAAVAVVLLALAASSFVAHRRSSQPFLPFEKNPLRTFGFAMTFLAGTAVVVVLPLARNLIVSGEPVLISSHGGLNFYIGNNATADGTYHHVEGITPSIEGQARDAKKVAEAAEGQALTTPQVSRHFTSLAFAWIREHPADALRLFLRKIAFTLNAEEITLDYSYAYYSREQTSVLTFLFVGAGILVPLGIVGLGVRAVEASGRAFLVWSSFVPVYALSVALFFVSSRYRLPLLPPLAAGAGMLLDRAGMWLKERRLRALVTAAAAVAPFALLAALDFHLDDGVDRERTELTLHLIEQGDAALAAREIERVAPHHRQPGVLYYRVGLALQFKERHTDAVRAFRQALALEPAKKEIELSLAVSEEKLALEHVAAGKAEEGMRELEEAVRLDPGGASARQNLAALYAEAGRFEEARELAREALRLNPGYPQAVALLEALDRRN